MPLSADRQSFYGFRTAALRLVRVGRHTMEKKRMNSRFVAGIMLSATLGCGLMAEGCVSAQAQFFLDPDRYGGPAGQMFGFESSPVAPPLVTFSRPHRPGPIIINTPERRPLPGDPPRPTLGCGHGG